MSAPVTLREAIAGYACEVLTSAPPMSERVKARLSVIFAGAASASSVQEPCITAPTSPQPRTAETPGSAPAPDAA